MIPQALIQYIETEIILCYEFFDKAHNLSHVQTVIEESLALAKDFDVNESMVYTIAAYHDIGLRQDRATHHIISGQLLKADDALRQWFCEEEIIIMAEAVEDHRASTDHEPRSIYGKIVAEADRIIDPDITLRRTVQYGLKHYPEATKEWHYQRFHQHLMEKYAPGGYLKLWFPHSKNAQQLKVLQSIIANEQELETIFKTLYQEENCTKAETKSERWERIMGLCIFYFFMLGVYPLGFFIALLFLSPPPVGPGILSIESTFILSSALTCGVTVLTRRLLWKDKVLHSLLINAVVIGICFLLSTLEIPFWNIYEIINS